MTKHTPAPDPFSMDVSGNISEPFAESILTAEDRARLDRLRDLNAELLEALKAYQSEAVRHGWDDHHNGPVMRLDGISLETTQKAHAAIAKAEGTDR